MVPAWNLIAVTTGGGFDFDEIEPLVVATLVDMNKPLPSNPAGAARLEAALAAISQPPAPKPVAPLPETARVISGKTFVFEPNPLEIEKLRLDFNDSAEAILYVTFTRGQMTPWQIGLDGVYRMSPGDYNFLQGHRGYWADSRTFVLEHDEIANNVHITVRMRFEGDHVVVEGQEASLELGVSFEGRAVNGK